MDRETHAHIILSVIHKLSHIYTRVTKTPIRRGPKKILVSTLVLTCGLGLYDSNEK